jgi:hypothetical protein
VKYDKLTTELSTDFVDKFDFYSGRKEAFTRLCPKPLQNLVLMEVRRISELPLNLMVSILDSGLRQ